ncbi:hypothetical protein RUMTOR_02929, partial [[Ruminococcus] torques ATCC 27756]
MAVLLALAMVTQGAMPVFAQMKVRKELRQRQTQKTAKILCKEYLSERTA